MPRPVSRTRTQTSWSRLGGLDVDLPPDLGVLGGIRQQVRDDLREAAGVPVDVQVPGHVYGQPVSTLFDQRTGLFDAFAHHVNQPHPLALQDEHAARDSRHVQEVVPQSDDVLHLPLDDRPLALPLTHAAQPHQLQGRHNRR
jgi:hypothetical protein